MDRIDLIGNVFRQLESPRQPIVDDLPKLFSLLHVSRRFTLKLEELTIRRALVEQLALEVLKVEMANRKA